jgi:hypothetical protein
MNNPDPSKYALLPLLPYGAALVDLALLPRLSKHKWWAVEDCGRFYVARRERMPGSSRRYVTRYLHKEILSLVDLSDPNHAYPYDGLTVSFRNSIGLDVLVSNLLVRSQADHCKAISLTLKKKAL